MSQILNLFDQSISLHSRIKALPIVHGSLEFSILLKKHFFDTQPDILAIELPEFLRSSIDKVFPYLNSFPILEIESDIKSYFIMESLEPLVEALRNAYEYKIPIYYVDIFFNNSILFERSSYDSFPDTYSLHHMDLQKIYEIFKKNYEKDIIFQSSDLLRELHMTLSLKRILNQTSNEQILFVCGIKHLIEIEKLFKYEEKEIQNIYENQLIKYNIFNFSAPTVNIYSLSEKNPEILSQPGYYNNLWIKFRNDPKAWKYFDRVNLQRNVYRLSKLEYESQSGEFIPPQKEKLFFQFTRNISYLYKKLIPTSLFLITAAKSFINDNFAKIFYEKLMLIAKENSPFPELELTLEDLGLDSTLIRFRTKIFNYEKKVHNHLKSKIHKKDEKEKWRELWNGEGICSYPKEDIIIEEFSAEIRKKAISLVKTSESRVFPFSSSLLDGIDYRESIRNYYKNTIYVKEFTNYNWEAGNLVIIFSEDEEEYNWKSVWWGEHEGEGDMAFYATNPSKHIVGPGIARCFYGGILLSYPPHQLSYIWGQYEFYKFKKAKDILLASGIVYNKKNVIVYIAHQPPSSKLNYLANRFGQRIVYLPISTINQKKLSRIRRFHVLSGHDKRKDADKYIW